MSKKIQIRLLPNGSIEMETQGIKGKKCTDYLKFLEKLTESKIDKVDYTPEYYEEEINFFNEEVENKND